MYLDIVYIFKCIAKTMSEGSGGGLLMFEKDGCLDASVCIGILLVRILSRGKHVVDLFVEGRDLLLSMGTLLGSR